MTITYHAGRRIQGLSTDIVDTPTLDEDFSTYTTQTEADAVWVPTNTSTDVNLTTDQVEIRTSTSAEGGYISLNGGSSISDSEWICRFRFKINTKQPCVIIVSDNTSTDSATLIDGIGLRITDTTNYVDVECPNGEASPSATIDHRFTHTPANQEYYIEIIRLSASSCKVNLYQDAYSTLIESSGTITGISGIASLKYLVFQSRGSNAQDTDIDDIQFYNGVSSLTSKPTDVQVGSRFEETDTRKIYYRVDYDNDKWQEEGSIYLGGTGVFGGGNDGSNSNVIDYITIATTGNATDFGDLTVARRVDAACDDSSRGLFCGISSGTIDYITIRTTGNAIDFGDMNTNGEGAGGVSSETRGCIGGGYIGGGNSTTTIDYVTIQTTGNASDFGDLTVARYGIAGGLSNNTRGCFAGGSGSTTTIDYITIATTGNATDFGDLTVGRYNMQGLSSSTRGCIGGGTATTNIIDYITIATTGNATDFGDLTIARRKAGGVSSETRGVWGGGHNGSTQTNVMDYITIDTTGNATDFGDLTVARDGSSGVAD